MDLYSGPFPKPVVSCNECHRFGCQQVPLGKCICCDNWGWPEHLVAPACMPVQYPMCRQRAHIVIEARATGLRHQPQISLAWVTGPTTEL
eukprot:3082770-Amphidinium_carterae.1